MWNGAIIVALLVIRGPQLDELITLVAWSTVIGSVLQFAVQLPAVMGLLKGFRPRLSTADDAFGQVARGFAPTVAARGVVQLSAYVDTAYASLLGERALSLLYYAQTIAVLPVSLFGMAISAAELPELSVEADLSDETRGKVLSERLQAGLERLAFFVVPSAVAFIALGDLIAAVLLQSGKFTAADARVVWAILMGAGVSLMAQTQGRLYSSVFFALKDTRTPFKIAAVRVAVGIALGYWAVRVLPGQLGVAPALGSAFITLTTGFTAWLELFLLRGALRARLGVLPDIGRRALVLTLLALGAAGGTLGLKIALGRAFGVDSSAAGVFLGDALLPVAAPLLGTSLGLLAAYAGLYGAATAIAGVPQGRAIADKVLRRLRRR